MWELYQLYGSVSLHCMWELYHWQLHIQEEWRLLVHEDLVNLYTHYQWELEAA
jgi:hypothetical protein